MLCPIESRPETDIPSTPIRGPGLLIVDADRPSRLGLAQDMTAAGFAVWTAPSGEVAVDTYLQHTGEIDALLVRVALPDLPVTEFLGWLRRHYPGVPCCCLAGVNDQAAAAQVKAAGGLVVSHPVSFHRLTAVLRRLILDAHPDGNHEELIFTEWQVVHRANRAG